MSSLTCSFYLHGQVDVYAFGVMLNEMLARQPPFAGMGVGEIRSTVLSGGRPETALSAPRVLQDIVTKCWDKDSAARPSFERILDMLKDASTKV